MSSKNPTVSFVIRTKDEEKFIGKVLKYVFTQTYKDFEVSIIDSESKDKTLEIVKKFPVKIFRLKQKDFSYSYSLNYGISKSKGKYICIMSGHSIPITDTWLDEGIKNFRNKKVAGVTGVCITTNPLGYFSRRLGLLITSLFLKVYKKKDTCCLTNTNSIIRRDLWKKYPFDEKLSECEDYDWGMEVISRGYRVIKDPKFSVFHSHIFLKKPKYITRWFKWIKIGRNIKNKRRPSKSFSKISTN